MSDRRLQPAAGTGTLVPPAGWLDRSRTGAEGPGVAFLALVTVIALGLRLLRLDAMSLWVDEVFTWGLVAPQPGADFLSHIMAAYQGPLYHAAAWPLVRLADTAFMLRLPAALAGTATVPLVGLLAGRLWGREAGRWAAVLACFSPFLVWYSQEARGYAVLIMFTAASGLALMDAVRLGITPCRAIVIALLCGGGLLGNFAFVLLLPAYGLTVLALARPRTLAHWALWALALGGGLLIALPWLLKAAGIWEVGRVVPGTETGQALRGETTFSPWALPFTAYAVLYGFTLGPSLAELHGPDRLAVVADHAPVVVLAALVAVVPLLWSLGRLGRGRWVVWLWILIPLAGAVLLAQRNVKPYNVRYVATIAPWVIMLLAAGLSQLALQPRRVVGGSLLALCVAALVGLHVEPRFAKADIRGAVAALEAHAAPGDLPVLAPTVGPVVRRYLAEDDRVRGCWDEAPLTDAEAADELVARQLAGARRAWILRARVWDLDPHDLLTAALVRRGRLERVHEGPGVTLDLWRRTPPDEGAAP